MASVTQLAQFLLKLNPQENVARLSFYHWIKNFLDLNSELQPQMIERFYDHALLTPYWQNNPKVLGESVHNDLLAFGHSHPIGFEVGKIRHCNTWQTVEIAEGQDFFHILKEKLEKENPGGKYKFVALSPNQILQVQVTANNGLEVCLYSNRMKVNGSLLTPLAPLTHLKYTSRLDLVPGVTQILQTSHLTWSRFQVEDGYCQGLLLKGYTFQKAEAFMGKPVNQYPELYYALKQTERHYVDLKSDPLYQELVCLLEKANSMAASHHPEATRFTEIALQKGRLALRNIFPNDKLLNLLVTNLEYRITADAKQGIPNQVKSENPCPNLHPLP